MMSAPGFAAAAPVVDVHGGNAWAGIWDRVTEVDDLDLKVSGRVPDGLHGRFHMSSSGDTSRADHFFDGDALVSAVSFLGPEAVTFRSRFVVTDKRRLEAAGRAGQRQRSFGTQASSWRGNFMRRPMSNALGDICVLPDRAIWVFNESGKPWALESGSLATVGEVSFGAPKRECFIGHGHLDRQTGELFGVATFFGLGRNSLAAYRRERNGRSRRLARVDLPAPYLPHDFAVSGRWIVCCLGPFVCSTAYAAYFGRKSFAASSSWRPDMATLVVLIARDGSGDVVCMETDPLFSFHAASAHDEGDDVVVDLSCYDDFGAITDQYFSFRSASFAPNRPTLSRLRIDTRSHRCTRTQIADVVLEDPTVDDRGGLGSVTDTVYGCSLPAGSDGLFTALTRVDVATGEHDSWSAGPGRVCGAPKYVADPRSDDEFDGWLVSAVYAPEQRGTDVVVLSARSLSAGPVAIAHIPAHVGFVFHSDWTDEDRTLDRGEP